MKRSQQLNRKRVLFLVQVFFVLFVACKSSLALEVAFREVVYEFPEDEDSPFEYKFITLDTGVIEVEISADPFYRDDLTSVALPKRVIPGYGFNSSIDQNSTEGYEITRIGNSAFPCRNLESITIPDTVSHIGFAAFTNCESLQNISLPESISSIEPITFFNCKSLKQIAIPNNVKSIGHNAFSGCLGLESISIPDSTTHVDVGVFRNCSALTSVTLGKGLTEIPQNFFEGCLQLEDIDIPGNILTIKTQAFLNCSSLKDVGLTIGLKHMEERVFESCGSLGAINIPRSMNSLSDGIFYLSGLRAITIPDSITSIGSHVFWDTNLTSIVLPNSVTSIGPSAFYGTKLTSIDLPESITNIGRYAFAYCQNLSSVKLPSSLKRIPERLFYECVSLQNIDIPETVSAIESEAFYHCKMLGEVIIPENLTFLGDEVFALCYTTYLVFNGKAPNVPVSEYLVQSYDMGRDLLGRENTIFVKLEHINSFVDFTYSTDDYFGYSWEAYTVVPMGLKDPLKFILPSLGPIANGEFRVSTHPYYSIYSNEKGEVDLFDLVYSSQLNIDPISEGFDIYFRFTDKDNRGLWLKLGNYTLADFENSQTDLGTSLNTDLLEQVKRFTDFIVLYHQLAERFLYLRQRYKEMLEIDYRIEELLLSGNSQPVYVIRPQTNLAQFIDVMGTISEGLITKGPAQLLVGEIESKISSVVCELLVLDFGSGVHNFCSSQNPPLTPEESASAARSILEKTVGKAAFDYTRKYINSDQELFSSIEEARWAIYEVKKEAYYALTSRQPAERMLHRLSQRIESEPNMLYLAYDLALFYNQTRSPSSPAIPPEELNILRLYDDIPRLPSLELNFNTEAPTSPTGYSAPKPTSLYGEAVVIPLGSSQTLGEPVNQLRAQASASTADDASLFRGWFRFQDGELILVSQSQTLNIDSFSSEDAGQYFYVEQLNGESGNSVKAYNVIVADPAGNPPTLGISLGKHVIVNDGTQRRYRIPELSIPDNTNVKWYKNGILYDNRNDTLEVSSTVANTNDIYTVQLTSPGGVIQRDAVDVLVIANPLKQLRRKNTEETEIIIATHNEVEMKLYGSSNLRSWSFIETINGSGMDMPLTIQNGDSSFYYRVGLLRK